MFIQISHTHPQKNRQFGHLVEFFNCLIIMWVTIPNEIPSLCLLGTFLTCYQMWSNHTYLII